MNERVKFIASYLEGDETFSDLCESFGISRKTGYKWVERYNHDGVQGLKDQSRAPLSHPRAVSHEIVQKVLTIRQRHPTWGPKKLRVVLQRREPELQLPAASTIGEILRRNHLIRPKRRRIRSVPYADRLDDYGSPNSVWCADFKGHFPVNGKRCHPLTISDGHSRFLIRCQALKRPLHEHVRPVFESAFREFGLPDAIRTDNGAPFSTLAPGGLSRLGIWWIKLGIRPERIAPGRPEQNGRHERMHRTLKAETARPPRMSFSSQQRAFDLFRTEYNEQRPHESIGMGVPASVYRPSIRAMPDKIPELQYPPHFEIRKTYPNGVISFGSTQWIISTVLKSEWVGLEEVDNDCWRVHFGSVALGILDMRQPRQVRKYRCFGTMVRLDGELDSISRREPRNS